MKVKSATYWRNRADKVWSDIIRQVGHCEYCYVQGTPRQDGALVKGLQAHHIIFKDNTPRGMKFRHDISNGVCLCDENHNKYSRHQLSPHGKGEAVRLWWKWLENNRPGQYQWYLDHVEDKKFEKQDWEQHYHDLVEIRDSNRKEQ